MALHHKALVLSLSFTSFVLPLSGMEEKKITIHPSQSKGEVKQLTVQPSIAQIWELAGHVTAEEYIEEFKKINCFKFRANQEEILSIMKDISKFELYKRQDEEELNKVKIKVDKIKEENKGKKESQEENLELKKLESEIEELEGNINGCDERIKNINLY